MSQFWNERNNDNETIQNRTSDDAQKPIEHEQYDFWSEQVNTSKREDAYQPNFIMTDSSPVVTIEEKGKEEPEIYSAYFNSEPVTKEGKETKKRRGIWWLKLVAGAAVFGLIAGVAFHGVNLLGKQSLSNGNLANNGISGNTTNKVTLEKTSTSASNLGSSMPSDVSEVVDATMPSIVSITSTVTTTYNYFGQSFDQESDGSGSGVIFEQNDNEVMIVTNNHVISGAKTIAVTFVGDEVVNAEVKGTDSTSDLAVLSVKISDMKKDTIALIKPITIGSSEDAKVGQLALAIGNALGYGQSLTVGYISAKDREVTVDNITMTLLQTDAAINPGNSGGALLNKDGELIGINSMKYADTSVEGMGYAIPISVATPIINELAQREILKEEEKGYLGVSGTDVTQDISETYNMPEGIYVSEVSEDSAAKEAGIVKGDIITKVNDTEVKSISALKERVNGYRVGTKVKLTIKRAENGSYKEKEVEVTLKGSKTIESLDDGTSNSQQNNQNNQDNNDDDNNNNGNNNNRGYDNRQNPYGNDQSIEDFFNDYFGY